MIVGVGSDLVEFARISEVLARQGEHFVHRVLGEQERLVFDALPERSRVAYLAKRFGAKEAIGKALGTGVAWPATLHQVQVLNRPSGQPYLSPGDGLSDFLQQKGWVVHVSLSDTREHALAFSVVEQK